MIRAGKMSREKKSNYFEKNKEKVENDIVKMQED